MSGLIFKCFIHLGFIFECGVSWWSNFTFCMYLSRSPNIGCFLKLKERQCCINEVLCGGRKRCVCVCVCVCVKTEREREMNPDDFGNLFFVIQQKSGPTPLLALHRLTAAADLQKPPPFLQMSLVRPRSFHCFTVKYMVLVSCPYKSAGQSSANYSQWTRLDLLHGFVQPVK